MFDTNVYGGPSFFTIWTDAEKAQNRTKYVHRKILHIIQQRLSSQDNKHAIATYKILDGRIMTTLQKNDGWRASAQNQDGATNAINSNSADAVCSSNANDRCWALLAFFRFFQHNNREDANSIIELLSRLDYPQLKSDLTQYKSLERLVVQAEPDAGSYVTRCSGKSRTDTALCVTTDYYAHFLQRASEYENRLLRSVLSEKAPEVIAQERDMLRCAIAHANYYGNEMYVTIGAVLHVVVSTQMKLRVQSATPLLGTNELFGSFMENAGYSIHIFNTAMSESNTSTSVDEDFCVRTLLAGSKYISRMLEALLLFNKSQNRQQIRIKELQTAFQAAEDARKNARSQTQQSALSNTLLQQLFWGIMENSGIWTAGRESFKCERQDFFATYYAWIVANVDQFYMSIK